MCPRAPSLTFFSEYSLLKDHMCGPDFTITCAPTTLESSFLLQLFHLNPRPTLYIKVSRAKFKLITFPYLILLYYVNGPTFNLDTKSKHLGMILDPSSIILLSSPGKSQVCNCNFTGEASVEYIPNPSNLSGEMDLNRNCNVGYNIILM